MDGQLKLSLDIEDGWPFPERLPDGTNVETSEDISLEDDPELD